MPAISEGYQPRSQYMKPADLLNPEGGYRNVVVSISNAVWQETNFPDRETKQRKKGHQLVLSFFEKKTGQHKTKVLGVSQPNFYILSNIMKKTCPELGFDDRGDTDIEFPKLIGLQIRLIVFTGGATPYITFSQEFENVPPAKNPDIEAIKSLYAATQKEAANSSQEEGESSDDVPF